MNRTAILYLALVLLGASPAPVSLISGTVRDQTGAPVESATVVAPGGAGQTQTASDGTFVLVAEAKTVQIRCRYCRTTVATVASDGTVVAIVPRYTALLSNGPSADDLAALPYGHIESAIALTPFVQLNGSKSVLPGTQLSDRGAQRGGGLIVDADAPNYDAIANVSPFYTIPQHYIQNVSAAPQSDAYLYGNVADGGTFTLDPAAEGVDVDEYSGSDADWRVGTTSGGGSLSAGQTHNRLETRQRADGSLLVPAGTGVFDLDATISDGSIEKSEENELYASYAAAHAGYERTTTFTVRADSYYDRGTYDADYYGTPLATAWSDAGGDVTVRGNGAVAPFATFAVRSSTGFYDATGFGIARFGASIGQANATFGVHATGKDYDALLAYGAYDAAYDGGVYGLSFKDTTTMTAPVARVSLMPTDRWTVTASASGGFDLPDLLAHYSIEAPLPGIAVDRDATVETTVEYSDGGRLRGSVTGLRRSITGMDTGTIGTEGASLAWQVAPAISLRTWWMRATPSLVATDGVRFGATPRAADTGSAWLTYQNGDGVRLDAIWRQDLIDYLPDAHLDASLSGPLAHGLRWNISSERRNGVRYTDVGVRFNAR